MRSIISVVAVLGLVAGACGGDGGGGGQPQTEAGAIEAVVAGTEGALRGNVGAVLDSLSADCRAAIDEDDVRLAVGLIPAFLGDLFEDFDLDEIQVEATIVDFDDDTARVETRYLAPDGTVIDEIGFDSEIVDLRYEDGKWVDADCDFEDTTERDAERLDEALAEVGYAATRDDPIPATVAAPVGDGFVVAVDSIDTDAAAAIEAAGGFAAEPEAGEQFVLVSMTVGFEGSDEPQTVSNVNTQVIGGSSGAGYDNSFGCGSFPTQLTSRSVRLFRGGVVTGDVCIPVPSEEIPGLQLAIEGGFGSDRTIVFDPAVAPEAPVPVGGSSGPDPEGRYADIRTSPEPVGEPVGIGDGWTITVRGFEDGTDEILAASEFNDPPPDGTVYGLLDYELAYDGPDQSASGFAVEVDLVGDSNVTADRNCNVSEVPGGIDRFADVFQGGSIAGRQCFVVDAGDVDSLVVFTTASFFGDDGFALAVR